jgi:hypothetical protein
MKVAIAISTPGLTLYDYVRERCSAHAAMQFGVAVSLCLSDPIKDTFEVQNLASKQKDFIVCALAAYHDTLGTVFAISKEQNLSFSCLAYLANALIQGFCQGIDSTATASPYNTRSSVY